MAVSTVNGGKGGLDMVKPRSRLVSPVDQRLRYAVARQVIESRHSRMPSAVAPQPCAGLGVAGKMAGDIDQRDRAGNHCRRSPISHSLLRPLRHLGIPLWANSALAAEPIIAGKGRHPHALMG